jgi:hypothetical protein
MPMALHSFDQPFECVGALPVPRVTWQASPGCPAAVAVHNDRYMDRQIPARYPNRGFWACALTICICTSRQYTNSMPGFRKQTNKAVITALQISYLYCTPAIQLFCPPTALPDDSRIRVVSPVSQPGWGRQARRLSHSPGLSVALTASSSLKPEKSFIWTIPPLFPFSLSSTTLSTSAMYLSVSFWTSFSATFRSSSVISLFFFCV